MLYSDNQQGDWETKQCEKVCVEEFEEFMSIRQNVRRQNSLRCFVGCYPSLLIMWDSWDHKLYD